MLGIRSLAISCCAVMAIGLIAACPVRASATVPDFWDGNWHYSITPYGWLPGISLKTRFESPSGSVQNQTSNNIYSYLSAAFMLSGEARKGRWGVYADLDWADFSNEKGRLVSIGGNQVGATLGLDTRWDLRGGMVNLAGIYSLGHGAHGYTDLVFGARYLKLRGSLSWNGSFSGNAGNANLGKGGQASGHGDFTDAIIGLKGAWTPFGHSRFFFPWYLDAGAGSGVTTYQVMAGVAYAFGWGNIALRYRDLEYGRSGGSQFLQRVRLSGPTLSATWRF